MVGTPGPLVQGSGPGVTGLRTPAWFASSRFALAVRTCPPRRGMTVTGLPVPRTAG